MRVLLITGGIGSGKSYACRYLHANYGWPIYEADKRVKQLYQTDPFLLTDIESVLGESVRDEHGHFQPSVLSNIIFRDRSKLEKVEQILFPVLLRDFQEWKAGYPESDFVILESATILEKPSLSGSWDLSLLIDAPVPVRVSRAVSRDGVDDGKIQARIDNQPLMNDVSSGLVSPPVDYVILNIGDTSEFEQKLDEFVQKFYVTKKLSEKTK